MDRIPGLTPTSQERLHAVLSASPVLRGGSPPDPGLVIAEAARAIHEAMPRLSRRDGAPTLPSRLQRMADGLRREGRAGLARDLDIAAGVVASLLLERSPACVAASSPGANAESAS